MRVIFQLLLVLTFAQTQAQTITEKIQQANSQLQVVDEQRRQVLEKIEGLKLQKIQQSLDEAGLPVLQQGDELVRHNAMVLAYAEKFEQARWVAHMITPDVMKGTITRTNDFRVDTKVKTGSAVEADYFLKKMKADSTWEYDAFGYDRGHLAPSADFRWSALALSESYYYSNMSPQLADFNRGRWGDLEDAIRGYIYNNTKTELFVVTGPVLTPGLPVIERGVNKVAIPRQYFKVVLDLANKRAIAFLMPNEAITKPIENFITSINEVETLTGLNFFNKIPTALQEQLESQKDASFFLPQGNSNDVEPLAQQNLPRNHFNTTTAKQMMGYNDVVSVCGTVAGARLSRAGNVLINLDKQFPNQVFTVFVKKEDILNFNYDLVEALKNKVICVKGKIINQGGTPTMYLEKQSELQVQE